MSAAQDAHNQISQTATTNGVYRPNLATASSVEEVQRALRVLRSHHDTVTTQVDGLIACHGDLSRHLTRIDLIRARLGTLSNSARALDHGQLSSAASTAFRLSEAVSRLDLEQDRVKATLSVVEQISELKQCVLGVVGSMGAPQDWETAAQYISRASQIPKEVITSGFAEDMVPTAEVPDPPAITLDAAAKSLCRLFLKEFEMAVEESDGARVTRFFKMFPLIGRSKEGLDAYGRYICQGVALRARGRLQGVSARTDGFAYVTALTKLFEHIAEVVDGHSHLVQRHYGSGTIITVMQRLHAEADKQGGIILDTWYDERTIDRKFSDVKSYAYNFLVQSFLQPPKGTATPRSMSPSPALKPVELEEESVDIKEVDQVLGEITAMLGHWSLYLRFVSSRVHEAELDESSPDEQTELAVPSFLENSALRKKVSGTLESPFKAFATFFLRRSVEKAFQLEESPSDLTLNLNKSIMPNSPIITSAVDDAMYMVSQMLQRSLATSQVSVVTSIISSIDRVLGSDFIGMTQRKMRDECYPKAAIQGAMAPEDKITSFLVLTNNLDVATEYIKRIVRTHIDVDDGSSSNGSNGIDRSSRPLAELFPIGRDASIVRNALQNMESTFCSKANDLIKEGIYVAFTKVMKDRMRPLVVDIFREVDYSIDDQDQVHRNGDIAEDGGHEEARSVQALTESGWEIIVKPMRRLLTNANADRLLFNAMSYFSNLLEKRIWNYHGRVSEFGAVQLEQDIAEIVNVTTKGASFRLRENFNRCLQIVSIMNMDEEEWKEIEADQKPEEKGGSIWVLSKNEQQRARTMMMNQR